MTDRYVELTEFIAMILPLLLEVARSDPGCHIMNAFESRQKIYIELVSASLSFDCPKLTTSASS